MEYWENFANHAFENTTQSVYSHCVLLKPNGAAVPCTFCFSIRRDIMDLPSLVIGSLPIAYNLPICLIMCQHLLLFRSMATPAMMHTYCLRTHSLLGLDLRTFTISPAHPLSLSLRFLSLSSYLYLVLSHSLHIFPISD